MGVENADLKEPVATERKVVVGGRLNVPGRKP